MSNIPITRGSILTPVTRAMHYVNAPAEKLLRNRNLPTWETGGTDVWVPTHAMTKLAQDMQTEVGPEGFSTWIEKASDLSALGEFEDTLRQSQTLHHALKNYCRIYRKTRTYASVSMIRRGGDLWLSRVFDPGFLGGNEILQIYGLYEMVRIVQLAAGESWKPHKIILQSRSDLLLKTIPALGGADATLGAAYCGIALPLEFLLRPVRSRGRGDTVKTPDDVEIASTPPQGFADTLSAILSTQFIDGCPSIETLAKSIDANVRTIQRRLAAEGDTYRNLIDRHRFESARRLIAQPACRITDVAAELGYNDTGSFTRAFRRWAGVSPSEFRKQQTTH